MCVPHSFVTSCDWFTVALISMIAIARTVTVKLDQVSPMAGILKYDSRDINTKGKRFKGDEGINSASQYLLRLAQLHVKFCM